jgi:ATP-dependent helicase Lhr and Lhr-like helicase
MDGLPSRFEPATRAWIEARFEAPTPVQRAGWPVLAARKNALLIAPTGSGKTLAAFLESIDRLGRLPEPSEPGVRVLYVSPLKALVYDIERNLRLPLSGIARAAESTSLSGGFRAPRVAVRTGDSSARDRRQQTRNPAEILVTTPESLYLILGSQQRESLRSVDTIIIDEIHALAPTKRGVHLALSLERLSRLAKAGDPQRIGLSATARPAEEIARFLGGDREVEIVDTSRAPEIDLEVSVPVPNMTRPEVGGRFERAEGDGESDKSLWPAIYPELLEGIRAHASSIIFVNSRGLCERLAQRLNELAGEPIVRAHHGSIAHDKRREIEEALASGGLRAIVATSSLELGIDMASVELVMLVESPGAIGRGLQRIGRAGHAVGETSRGIVFPKHRADLLEAAVVAIGMRAGEIEPVRIPSNPLDVLAQQIVAIASEAPISVQDLESMLARTASYEKLSRELLDSVLDMLAGRYPSTDFAELRPRILWDRETNHLEAREGAARIALLSGGTIPDRGQYAVHLGPGGPRIGELDEEMVHETKPGDVVTLGASSWRALEITRDRVIVAPAPGEAGRLPFWHGEGPGRPIELGRAIGRFTRELEDRGDAREWLVENHGLDEFAARNLVDYLEEQRDWTGVCPTDERITIERFRDELGDWRLCILSPFGSRIHAPWALAIASLLSERGDFDAQPLWTDDGIMFRFADADRLPPAQFFLPDPDEIEERIVSQLGSSALFASQFRENAARALLLPRRRPGARTPLWAQRLRAQNLQAVARAFPDFPIMLETYRSCVQDVFDLPGLIELMQGVRSRAIGVDDVETRSASPFARSLAFAYTASYLYQLDMPVAERRTQALSLDRHMLRELLGAEALRELLDVEIIDRVEARLQGLDLELKARHGDGLHDLFLRIGDLDEAELLDRFEGDEASLRDILEGLVEARRVTRIEIAGQARVIATEDAGLYRDALGVTPPPNLPSVFLEPPVAPLEQLLMRYSRKNGPFTTSRIARRFGLLPAQVELILEALASQGRLLSGEFDPRGSGREWCEPEVLRRIKRGTLNRLRDEVSPVGGDVLGRFLLDWHGIGLGGPGTARLDEVIDLIEGVPISFAELERSILPARVRDFAPSMLDALGALGQVVWIGHGAIGEKDGRVALYRRDRIATLFDPPTEIPERSSVQRSILAHLESRGASFFAELVSTLGVDGSEALFDALWELVWMGLVTNDTFAPLRALGIKPPPHRRRGRRPPPSATAGRWSLVAPLLVDPPSATECLHARTLLLLDRHGVVSRNSMQLELQPGGFGAVYPMLREMEETGRIRRGLFIEGMSSAQFATPGAVDRLRALRGSSDEPVGVLLAATDPAQPYGAALDWPQTRRGVRRPRRAVGAAVVLVDGTPCLFIDGGGQRVLCFDDVDHNEGQVRVGAALRAWVSGAARLGRGRISIEDIDGEKPRSSDLARAFVRAGFRAGYRGFELDRLGPHNEVESGFGGDAAPEHDALGTHEKSSDDGNA